jgi:hypothetical protein
MTRRPIKPIAEQGVYTKPWKRSFGDAVEDAIFIALSAIIIYPIVIVRSLFEKEK